MTSDFNERKDYNLENLLSCCVLSRFGVYIDRKRKEEATQYLLSKYGKYLKNYKRGKHFKNITRKIVRDNAFICVFEKGTAAWMRDLKRLVFVLK